MDNIDLPCECPGAGYCSRFNREVIDAEWKWCAGKSGLGRQKELAYLKHMKNGFRAAPSGLGLGGQVGRGAGVAIGHYGMPRIAELQVKLIRKHCGEVPILICDDCSGAYDASILADIAKKDRRVDIRFGEKRLGHYGGDGAAFYRAIVWGMSKGLSHVVKLSQRYLIDKPDWLNESVKLLQVSNLPAASWPCIDGDGSFLLRTEAVLMSIYNWNRPEVLAWLEPREYRHGVTEWYVWSVIATFLGGKVMEWPLMGGADRAKKVDGVLFHTANSEEEYRALAAREGIDLGSDFTCANWQGSEGYKT